MNGGIVINRYLLLGIILCLSTINLTYGLVVLFLYMVLGHRLVIQNNDTLGLSNIENTIGFDIGLLLGIVIGVAIGLSGIFIIRQKNT